MPDLVALYGWPMLALLAAAAAVVGFSKTSFGGAGALAVAAFALAVPARESTATVLILLIVGDVVAVWRYRTVQWSLLRRLLPSVLPGLLLGAVFINLVDDHTMRRAIGVLLLGMVALRVWQRRRPTPPPDTAPRLVRTVSTGVLAGFTTMTANAAAPVMALYFVAARIEKSRFIGTNAWYFLIVNLCKVPLTAGLGLFTPHGLFLDLVLVPAVLLGAALGAWVVGRVSQRSFENVTLAASALAATSLLLR